MKNYINLLPKEDQKELVLEKMGDMFLNLFIWVLISLGVMTILFFAGSQYLKSELSSVTDQIELKRQVVSQAENKKLKQQLQDFNIYLDNLVKLGEQQTTWSDIMMQFASLVPADVAIDSFSSEKENGRIRISGFAKTRDSVLKLRNNLLGSDYFENVNFPLSNLVKPKDLNFYYVFYVKQEVLLRK